MGFFSKAWKTIKKVVGVAAMIAAPFVAGPVAAAIGVSGTIGTALTGAAIGGLGASAAGVDPRIGLAVGGLGSLAVGMGAPAAAGAGGTAASGSLGSLFSGAAPGSTASILGTTGKAAAAAAPAAAGLATAGGGLLGTGVTLGNLAQLAPLAFALYGKAPQDLTEVEKQNLIANADTAATERGVFNQRLDAARSVIQQGQANPEQAYATAQLGVQRGLREAERTASASGAAPRAGLQDANRRRAAIEGARIGTAAVTGENVRAAQTTAAGLSMLPTDVPTSAAELNKTIYADLYKRRNDFGKDLATAAGQMYGQNYGNIA